MVVAKDLQGVGMGANGFAVVAAVGFGFDCCHWDWNKVEEWN